MKTKPEINFTPIGDLFGTGEQSEKENSIIEVKLDLLKPFKNHPYKVIEDESMQELVESIRQNGVIYPALVRQHLEGGYEIIAGHRRKRACELAGLETMPVDVKDVDDDTAILMMVNTNFQRERVLPSEKAFAYKLMMDAMKRKSGRKTKDSSDNGGATLRSKDILAQITGESAKQLQRFIRLTELSQELLLLVDNGKIPMRAAVDLSYLSKDTQSIVNSLAERNIFPSMAQASKMRNESKEGELSDEDVNAIIFGVRKNKPVVTFKWDVLSKFFPDCETVEEMREATIRALNATSKH